MVCFVEDCGREAAGMYCEMHRARVRRHGDPHVKLTGQNKPCVAGECDQAPKYRIKAGTPLCPKHYQRWRRVGSWSDDAVKARGTTWIDSKGYRCFWRDRRSYKEHRWVMEQHLNRRLFPDENVHHRNGDRLDNRLENLELWSTSQPSGQRVVDKIEWAQDIIARYADSSLVGND